MAPSLRVAAVLVLLAATQAAGRERDGPETRCRVTDLETYPGYAGGYQVKDYRIKFTLRGDDELRVKGDLTFEEEDLYFPEEAEGGLHIHTGSSCSSADLVGGHLEGNRTDLYTPNGDPWFNEFGAVYTVGGEKRKEVKFTVYGFTKDLIDGRTVVLHEPSGTRMACGILKCSC